MVCSSVSRFSIGFTSAPSAAFSSTASRNWATERLLDGRSGTIESNPGVGNHLNALFDSRCQLVRLVLHLLPRAARPIKCQFSLFIPKVDLARLTRQGHHNGLQCKVDEQIKQIE
jgi:hypothetical protein